MFSEFDILKKEISNDYFMMECVIEAESLQDMISVNEIFTEAEGGVTEKIQALIAKIKETAKKLVEQFKATLQKIFTSHKVEAMKARAEELKEKYKALAEECKNDPELAKRVADAMDDLELAEIERIDPNAVQKYTASAADKCQAWIKNVSAKISNGETVSAEEIAKGKALGEIEPFKMPKVAKIALKVAAALLRIESIFRCAATLLSISSLNPSVILTNLAGTTLDQSLAKGCDKLAKMADEDKKNVTENQLIASASQVSSVAAALDAKLQKIELDAYADQISILSREIDKLESIVNRFKKAEKAEAEA